MRKAKVGEHVTAPYMAFTDRRNAGRRLAEFMAPTPDAGAVVLALTRGGIPVGVGVAEALNAPLEPVIVRKLAVPFSPEAGFGAVTSDGTLVLNDRLTSDLRLPRSVVDDIIAVARDEAARRAVSYGVDALPDVVGRRVYLVDDGLASGYTMLAAERMVRKLDPESIVMAVPVSPADSLDLVSPWFEEAYCLIVQTHLPFAVASFYRKFHDLSDEEALAIVEERKRALSGR